MLVGLLQRRGKITWYCSVAGCHRGNVRAMITRLAATSRYLRHSRINASWTSLYFYYFEDKLGRAYFDIKFYIT